jgi:hypothetical protein
MYVTRTSWKVAPCATWTVYNLHLVGTYSHQERRSPSSRPTRYVMVKGTPIHFEANRRVRLLVQWLSVQTLSGHIVATLLKLSVSRPLFRCENVSNAGAQSTAVSRLNQLASGPKLACRCLSQSRFSIRRHLARIETDLWPACLWVPLPSTWLGTISCKPRLPSSPSWPCVLKRASVVLM